MSRIIIAAILLAACGDNSVPVELTPDAGSDASRWRPQVPESEAHPIDAGVDSFEGCWQYVAFTCDNVIIQSCVPYNGCSEPFECHGQQLSYCHVPTDGGQP